MKSGSRRAADFMLFTQMLTGKIITISSRIVPRTWLPREPQLSKVPWSTRELPVQGSFDFECWACPTIQQGFATSAQNIQRCWSKAVDVCRDGQTRNEMTVKSYSQPINRQFLQPFWNDRQPGVSLMEHSVPIQGSKGKLWRKEVAILLEWYWGGGVHEEKNRSRFSWVDLDLGWPFKTPGRVFWSSGERISTEWWHFQCFRDRLFPYLSPLFGTECDAHGMHSHGSVEKWASGPNLELCFLASTSVGAAPHGAACLTKQRPSRSADCAPLHTQMQGKPIHHVNRHPSKYSPDIHKHSPLSTAADSRLHSH